jgi:hypothetical protein
MSLGSKASDAIMVNTTAIEIGTNSAQRCNREPIAEKRKYHHLERNNHGDQHPSFPPQQGHSRDHPGLTFNAAYDI